MHRGWGLGCVALGAVYVIELWAIVGIHGDVVIQVGKAMLAPARGLAAAAGCIGNCRACKSGVQGLESGCVILWGMGHGDIGVRQQHAALVNVQSLCFEEL